MPNGCNPTYNAEADMYYDCDVDVECLGPEITEILADISEKYHDQAGETYQVLATSACRENDGSSLHDDGLAIDLRTINLEGGGDGPLAQSIRNSIATALGDDYDVILHCGTCWHIHVEYDPPEH